MVTSLPRPSLQFDLRTLFVPVSKAKDRMLQWSRGAAAVNFVTSDYQVGRLTNQGITFYQMDLLENWLRQPEPVAATPPVDVGGK